MSRPRILLVEDDSITRFVMNEMMSGFGIDTDMALNGVEALEALEKNPQTYAFILMDLHLPQVSGLETVGSIRRNSDPGIAELPIIAFTGDTSFHDESRVSGHGMDGFAKKPVTPGQLVTLIDKYCSAA